MAYPKGKPASNRKPVHERFWKYVNFTDTCWLWTGSKDTRGYGQIKRNHPSKGTARAHRVAYELLIGIAPVGLDLDHLCRIRHCVNPYHLEPVTRSENAKRGMTGKHSKRQIILKKIFGF